MDTRFEREQVGIVDFPETPVAVLEHRGDPGLLGDSIRRFIAWRRQAGLHPSTSATFNILYSDPERAPPAAYRIGLCAATAGEVAPNADGVSRAIIPAGRCAVLRLHGSDDGLGPAAAFLYTGWLPASGEALRDFPLFCQRVVLPLYRPGQEAVTDLFLPLQ